jgi:two-component system, chemotaxis family, sensor kinase CheA
MQTSTGFFSRYKILIFAIAIFFVLSIGIFSFNLYSSQQLSEDAAHINDSGKMRGLTQQNAKAVLALSQELTAGEPIQTSQAQISESILGMEEILKRTRSRANQAHDDDELELLKHFEKGWGQLAQLGREVIGMERPDAGSVDALRSKSFATNVRLLQDIDDLTQHLEESASARANQLKLVQAAAIAIALINFFFIVFYAFRSLANSDRIAFAARQETEQILDTVREGLFLIDREATVGQQRSGQLESIFPKPLPPGASFNKVLAPLVSRETLESVENYVSLLFNKRVKPALIQSLNPLTRVEIAHPGKGANASIFLSFGFSPVRETDGNTVAHLLVSVVDVSQEVFLERELESAEERAKNDMALLLGVLDNDPAVVGAFLATTTERLNELNTVLKEFDPHGHTYREVINLVLRVIHGIKGEASALRLGPISQAAHSFEDVLVPLRHRELSGEDLIPVATGIGGMQQAVAKVSRITGRIGSYATTAKQETTATPEPSAEEDVQQTLNRIQRLALSVAADLNKKIRVETSLSHIETLPESIHRLLREGLPQLVRNAIVHGIEDNEERSATGKHPEGLIRIELKRDEAGAIEIIVTDDGRGIDVERLRGKLVESGQFTPEAVAQMSDRDVASMIFRPGFSTAEAVTDHAGRGFGLDVLFDLVRTANVRLRVSSTPSVATSFILQWSPAQ